MTLFAVAEDAIKSASHLIKSSMFAVSNRAKFNRPPGTCWGRFGEDEKRRLCGWDIEKRCGPSAEDRLGTDK